MLPKQNAETSQAIGKNNAHCTNAYDGKSDENGTIGIQGKGDVGM